MIEDKKKSLLFYIFYKLPVWMLFGISIYITGVSAVTMANQNEKLKIHPGLVVIPGVMIFVVILFCLFQVVKRMRHSFYFIILSLGVIFLIQLFLVFFAAEIYPITDCYTTLDEAVSMISQHGLLDNTSDYFGHYPNNYFFTIMMYYVFLIAKFFKIPYLLFAVIINILMINLSIFIGYFIVKEVLNENSANCYILLSVLCPTNYVFVYFPYTNTFSMPFISGIIYFGLKKGGASRIAFILLSVIGFCLRPTSLFATIAVLIYYIFYLKETKFSKKMVFHTGLLLFLTVSIFFAEHIFVKIHVLNPNHQEGFPATHWIMVGLQKTGEYNGKDVAFTQSQKSKKEKISANIKEIEKRVKKLGLTGIFRLYLIKIGKIWAVGTDDFQNLNNSDAYYSKLYDKIFGDDNLWLIFYCQVFRCATFLFIIGMLLKMGTEKKPHIGIVFTVGLLGIILFLMIWETNKKHSICYTHILLMMMCFGINSANVRIRNFLEIKAVKPKKLKRIAFTCAGISLCLMCSIHMILMYFAQQHNNPKRVIYKTEWNMSKIPGANFSNQDILQNFTAQKDFSEIKIHINIQNKKQTNVGSIKMQLLDEKDTLVNEKDFQRKDLTKRAWIGFDHLKCTAGIYKLVIKFTGDCSFINFLYYSGKKMEHFKGTSLYVGKKRLGVSSLSIRVYA